MEIQILKCPSHGDVQARVIIGPHPGGHWAKAVCPTCDRWLRWLPKPDSDPTKYKRESQHRDLVAAYSPGYCELCMRDAKDIPVPQVLEAHHVVEYEDGGTAERKNIWIVCTACHKLIHHQRTYLGHVRNLFRRPDEQDQNGKYPASA